MVKLAINGYGRIGRNILRAIFQAGLENELQIIAINDLADYEVDIHLTRFDSTHGRFDADITLEKDHLRINEHTIQLLSHSEIKDLPWGELGIDIVLECTGRYKNREPVEAHLQAGARKVLVSAPLEKADLTTVYGVNHHLISSQHRIVSNASCTTNCLAPVAAALHDGVGIEHGQMTTIHAITNDQALIDHAHGDLYRARTASISMIPSGTGAAKAVGLVLPELDGKLTGMAVRVPTLNVSLVDLHFLASRDTSREEINSTMQKAVAGRYKDIMEYSELPLVSVDFNHNPSSAIFDSIHTSVIGGRQVKVMAWYDNEWGFSNRMLDTIRVMDAAGY
jgi:glyceraldehyde 3-phosphate dehydrogenase